jgi:transketolase
MRADSTRAIEELALGDPKVVVIASDPSKTFMPELAAKHPERLMIEGICEQGVVGMAAGLASTGFYPYIIMLAVFATRRCYEQLLLDFGLHGFSGCMVANGGGFNYSSLGPTHIAVDDMTLTSSIPGSAVLAPADPEEAVSLVLNARHYKGLTYFRNAATTQSLARPRGAIAFGKARLLEEPGSVLFISCGASTLAAEAAVARLRGEEIDAGLLHVHTVKPLDVEAVRRYSAKAKVVICAEEHRQIGGLSSSVLHALNTGDRPIAPARFASVGVDDAFPTGNGSYEEMLEHYGLTSEALVLRAQTLLANIDDRKVA